MTRPGVGSASEEIARARAAFTCRSGSAFSLTSPLELPLASLIALFACSLVLSVDVHGKRGFYEKVASVKG